MQVVLDPGLRRGDDWEAFFDQALYTATMRTHFYRNWTTGT